MFTGCYIIDADTYQGPRPMGQRKREKERKRERENERDRITRRQGNRETGRPKDSKTGGLCDVETM